MTLVNGRYEWVITDTRASLSASLRLRLQVQANPEFCGVVARGGNVLPNRVVEDAFRGLYGQTLNFAHFARAVQSLDKWYRSKGLLGQVADFSFQVTIQP